MAPTFAEIVQAELLANNIVLCPGGDACTERSSHARGFAVVPTRTIHYSAKCATRATLHGFLHEVGHIVLGHCVGARKPRWQEEAEAEHYASESLRQLGIAVPRKAAALGRQYVARMRRWGRNIAAGRRAAQVVAA